MGLIDRLLGRSTKAAPLRTAPPGGSVTFLGGAQQGQRMANFSQYLRAISVPNVWKCVSVIAANAGATELLWRDQDGNEVDLKTYLPDLYTLLRRPNAETRSLVFTQAVVLDLLLTGNHFCLLDEYDGLGRPHALYRLPPDRVRIIRSDVGNLAFGVDIIQNGVTRTEWYDQSNILHIKTFFNPTNPLFGLGNVEASELSISRDRLIGEYSLNFFQKGAVVDSVLVSPNDVPEEDRKSLIEGWNAFRSGNRNRFKTALLSAGVTFQKIQESVADVQLPQLANMALEDVCQCFGTPKQMLGDFRESNYRNSQEANSFFITETLSPLLRQIEQDFWEPLGELFDPDIRPEYDIREVNDFQLRCQSAAQLAGTGAATINQILVMAGLDPRDDDIGDRLVQPQGVTLVEPDAIDTVPAAEPGAAPGVKSYPEALLSRKKRVEQRKRGIKQLAPRDPAEPLLRLLAGAESTQGETGAKTHDGASDAPGASGGRKERVTVSAAPHRDDTARIAHVYAEWAQASENELWEAAEADGTAQA